jgi:hypothetical protein
MKELCFTIATIALTITACGSPTKERFEQIARQANPRLTELRAAAKSVIGARPQDRVAIIQACTSLEVDAALWELRKLRFDDERLQLPAHPIMHPSFYADYLLIEQCELCGARYPQPDKMSARQLDTCARFCRETWQLLVESVEVVRTAAGEHDVELVSLKPD